MDSESKPDDIVDEDALKESLKKFELERMGNTLLVKDTVARRQIGVLMQDVAQLKGYILRLESEQRELKDKLNTLVDQIIRPASAQEES